MKRWNFFMSEEINHMPKNVIFYTFNHLIPVSPILILRIILCRFIFIDLGLKKNKKNKKK